MKDWIKKSEFILLIYRQIVLCVKAESRKETHVIESAAACSFIQYNIRKWSNP